MKRIIDAKVNFNHTHFYIWQYFNAVKREEGKGRWVRVTQERFFDAIKRSTEMTIDADKKVRIYSHMSDI